MSDVSSSVTSGRLTGGMVNTDLGSRNICPRQRPVVRAEPPTDKESFGRAEVSS